MTKIRRTQEDHSVRADVRRTGGMFSQAGASFKEAAHDLRHMRWKEMPEQGWLYILLITAILCIGFVVAYFRFLH